MLKGLLLFTAIIVSAVMFGSCENMNTNTNANANANANARVSATSPTATPTPRYTEEQAREERERAKSNKETVGQSLEDAWTHAKIVAKLIGDTQTPERKINVDVVDGVVTLRGTVDTVEAKTEAARIARETEGVKNVVDQLKVAPAAKKK